MSVFLVVDVLFLILVSMEKDVLLAACLSSSFCELIWCRLVCKPHYLNLKYILNRLHAIVTLAINNTNKDVRAANSYYSSYGYLRDHDQI